MPQVISHTAEWIVVAKEAGWLTIPGRDPGSQAPVLSDELKKEWGEVFTVHRLDRETSGVVLFARTAEAHRKANQWFSGHKTSKIYDCLAQGMLAQPVLKIDSPIAGAASITQVEKREAYPGCFLARARIVTGRRHQIRIHLSQEGHPLLGDLEYQGSSSVTLPTGESLVVGRVALHASRLELPSGEVFEAPWPADFQGWVETLRKAAGR